MIDSMLDGFKQILLKRQEIPSDQHEAFDVRITPIQRQTQAIINAIMTLIEKPLPKSPTSPTMRSNIFDDCFIPEEQDAYGGVSSSSGQNQYDRQLTEQTQTKIEKQADDMKFKLQSAKEDAEATKKLAQVRGPQWHICM